MNIGENIRHYRKKLNMTQAQLADRVGVTVQAVSKWETGTGIPDTTLLIPLARALNIKTDTLLSYRDREQEYTRRWQHALRYSYGDTTELQKVCLEILEEDPENVDFLYRAAMNEQFMAEGSVDEAEKHSHLSRSRHYTEKLLRLDPDHESAKLQLVETLSAMGLDDEAVAQAYRCTDSSLALLYCLKGDALRRHRQKRIDEKFNSLLNEIDQAGMPDVTDTLIRAAIPDGNNQHYTFYMFHHGWQRAQVLYAGGDEDAVMAELHTLFAMARQMDQSKEQPRFTAPLFDLLESPKNLPGDSTYVHQFIHEARYLFRDLQHRDDYKQLIADAMAYGF